MPDKSLDRVRDSLHDVLELQHIAQGRGQKREEYEPAIIEQLEGIIISELQNLRQQLASEIKELGRNSTEKITLDTTELGYNIAIVDVLAIIEGKK